MHADDIQAVIQEMHRLGSGPLNLDWRIVKELADRLSALVIAQPQGQERLFPIQDGPDIPWSMIAPFEKQAQRQHGRQTLERLSERGGLSVAEVLSVLEGEGDFGRYWQRHGGETAMRDKTANILKLQRLVSERAPAAPPQGWREIASAPKDGTRILVCRPMTSPHPVEWRRFAWVACWNREWLTSPGGYQVDPTHWQPLPEAPQGVTEQDEPTR